VTGGPPPFRPGEGQSSWILLRQEAEIRTRLERLRSGLADPALNRVVEGLARPDVVRERLSALALSLEEALRTLGTLHAELTHPFETREAVSAPTPVTMEGGRHLRRGCLRRFSSPGDAGDPGPFPAAEEPGAGLQLRPGSRPDSGMGHPVEGGGPGRKRRGLGPPLRTPVEVDAGPVQRLSPPALNGL
jgi:hypothetical protein